MAIEATTTTPETVPLLINGQDRTAAPGQVFSVTSPGTGKIVWEASAVLAKDAVDAVDAAQNAFPPWAATKPIARRAILLKAADLLESRAEEIKDCMIKETGAQPAFAQFNVNTACELTRDVAGRISSALSGSAPVCEQNGTHALVVKEPYGVVLGIAPWWVSVCQSCSQGSKYLTLKERTYHPWSAVCSLCPCRGKHMRPQGKRDFTAVLLPHWQCLPRRWFARRCSERHLPPPRRCSRHYDTDN